MIDIRARDTQAPGTLESKYLSTPVRRLLTDSESPPLAGKVFISYAHNSKFAFKAASWLRDRLKTEGIDCFPDTADLDNSQQWLENIQGQLAGARALLYLIDSKAGNSIWMEKELELAQEREIPIVPLLIESGAEIPPTISHRHYLDLSGDREWDLEQLIRRLRDLDTSADAPASESTQTRTLLVPDIDWVEVPAGPFVYQDGETRELPTFWLGRYPVTNIQYQTFIDDGGYADEHWWRGLERPETAAPDWPQANRPRTDVGWYEAVAFARWLNARLGLPEDSIRLPIEFEWEKAARGEKGLQYPWGNDYRSGFANLDEKTGEDGPWYLEQTTAVGLFPQGRSPYGIEDMAGSVWEWCLNKYEKAEQTGIDTRGDARVLRGGSWINESGAARAGLRYGGHPGNRYYYWGFRLLCSVPIPGS